MHTYIEAKDLLRYTIDLLESSSASRIGSYAMARIRDALTHRKTRSKALDTKVFDNGLLFFAEEGIRSHIGRLLEKGKVAFI